MNSVEKLFAAKADQEEADQLPLPFAAEVFATSLAIPKAFAQSAAFTHARSAVAREGSVPSLEGVSVRLDGLHLTQTHLSLFLAGVTLAAQGGNTEVASGKRELLRAAGMSEGGGRTKALVALLADLQATVFEAKWQGGRSFRGVLVTSFWVGSGGSIKFRINPDVVELLRGATYIEGRVFLGLSPVARQLCAYAAHQEKYHKVGASKWMPIFGFRGAAKEANRRMRQAGKELKEIKFLDYFAVDRDGLMHVRRAR